MHFSILTRMQNSQELGSISGSLALTTTASIGTILTAFFYSMTGNTLKLAKEIRTVCTHYW